MLLTNLMQLYCNHKQLRAPSVYDCKAVIAAGVICTAARGVSCWRGAGVDLDGRGNHEKRREEFIVIAVATCSGKAVLGRQCRHVVPRHTRAECSPTSSHSMLASLVAYTSQGLTVRTGWIHHSTTVSADPVVSPTAVHQGRAVTGALPGIRDHCVVHLLLLVPAEEVYARNASHVFTPVKGREQAGRGNEPVVCRRRGLCRRTWVPESQRRAMPDTWRGGAGPSAGEPQLRANLDPRRRIHCRPSDNGGCGQAAGGLSSVATFICAPATPRPYRQHLATERCIESAPGSGGLVRKASVCA